MIWGGGFFWVETLPNNVTKTTTYTLYSSGAVIANTPVAAQAVYGTIILTLQKASTFTWAINSSIAKTTTPIIYSSAGIKSTSAQMDRIQITTTAGSDTFDAGTISVAWE